MKEVVAELSQKELDEIIKQQEEIAEYKEIEKQGRLIKLPCAVGDTVYIICNDGYILGLDVYSIEISNRDEITVYGAYMNWAAEDFGETVFRTHEEAEAALKGADE